MATEPKRIAVRTGTELARLLDEAVHGPVVLEKDGVTFSLTADAPRRQSDYDAQNAVAIMRASAGSWADVDAEAIKAFLYRAREEGTRQDGGQ